MMGKDFLLICESKNVFLTNIIPRGELKHGKLLKYVSNVGVLIFFPFYDQDPQ